MESADDAASVKCSLCKFTIGEKVVHSAVKRASLMNPQTFFASTALCIIQEASIPLRISMAEKLRRVKSTGLCDLCIVRVVTQLSVLSVG